jgi:hypothetical protein
MTYTASISASDARIARVFAAADTSFRDRASFTVSVDDGVTFSVTAEDATALRVMNDAIIKGLKLYEDMRDIS